jgi:hypothetical protein
MLPVADFIKWGEGGRRALARSGAARAYSG